ncbi:SpoIIE family protein phosphatase [Streptomyces sp. NPDC001941]|uniref:SpoIIE family protein phosphatase n=1 Tax=Streptomyces sp. NPDC001941 TaxID=3154659 RepID=UPI003317EEEF
MADRRAEGEMRDAAGPGRTGRLVLMAGLALAVLVPNLHTITTGPVGSALGMDDHAWSLARTASTCSSLAGLFWAGRTSDVHGARRVVLGSLLACCAGSALLVSATGPGWYAVGLAVQGGGLTGAVAGYLASAPFLHLTGRLCRVAGAAFAALAAVHLVGVLLARAAEAVGGWRAAEAVPLLVSAGLFLAALRFLPRTARSAFPSAAPPLYRAGGLLVVLLGGVLQASPLSDRLDVYVVLLLAVALLAAVLCTAPPSEQFRLRRTAMPLSRSAFASARGPAVMAGGVWGFGQTALAIILFVPLTGETAGQWDSLLAWAGFGIGLTAAGLYALRAALKTRTSSALGFALAALGMALLFVLPHTISVTTLLSAVIGFGITLPQVPWVAQFLAGLPARSRGSAVVAYPAAILLGGAAVTSTPYASAITQATRTTVNHQLLWITVAVLAVAAVVLGHSAAAVVVPLAAAAQYLLVATVSDRAHAQRPLALATFLLIGAAIGFAVWARRRQTDRLAHTLAAATALQHAVLRPLPSRVGGLELAGLYRAATTDTGIGGDFYDVAHTPFGTRVLLGDVRGKGLQAVQTVTDVLGCFRSLAHETASLAELTARLDRHLARAAETRRDSELFATAILLELPDDASHLNALNCGHLPPMAIGPDGEVSEVDLPPLLPLGCGFLDPDSPPAPARLDLPHGTVLLLYTDGLTEARNALGAFYPLTTRLRDLRTDDPSLLVSRLLSDSQQWTHSLTDDIALIALRRCQSDQRPEQAYQSQV